MKSAFLALSVVVITLMLVSGSPRSAEAATCSYTLGFKTLHDFIPATVGGCLVDEHHNPTNGDGLQETIGVAGGAGSGLLVWRKADNWTAYTDGYHTWINGPKGLQERLNTELLPWEAGFVAPQSPAPTAGVPAQDIAYLTTRLSQVNSLQKAIVGMATQSSLAGNDPTLLRDTAWETTTALYLVLLQTTGKSFQTYDGMIPADMIEVDGLFATVGRDMVAAATDYATGVDTLNVSYLSRSLAELQLGGSTLGQITSKLGVLKSKYGLTP